jgi:ribose 5-phosphate isomerase B
MIALGADHAGWQLKEEIKTWLLQRNVELLDLGTHSPDPADYPDYAAQVGEAVASGKATRGILVCGTGIGMAMTANKVPGVRAAFCPDLFTARMSREHNDANVLALGGRLTGRELALEIIEMWLRAEFQGGRHSRRLGKITELERRYGPPAADPSGR